MVLFNGLSGFSHLQSRRTKLRLFFHFSFCGLEPSLACGRRLGHILVLILLAVVVAAAAVYIELIVLRAVAGRLVILIGVVLRLLFVTAVSAVGLAGGIRTGFGRCFARLGRNILCSRLIRM
jgi:hypothetical protein